MLPLHQTSLKYDSIKKYNSNVSNFIGNIFLALLPSTQIYINHLVNSALAMMVDKWFSDWFPKIYCGLKDNLLTGLFSHPGIEVQQVFRLQQ